MHSYQDTYFDLYKMSDVLALWQIGAATLQCLDVTPPSCRAEPAIPFPTLCVGTHVSK